MFAVCMGFYACTATSRHAGSNRLPDDFNGVNAPVWYHAEAIKKYLVDQNPHEAAVLLEKAMSIDSG